MTNNQLRELAMELLERDQKRYARCRGDCSLCVVLNIYRNIECKWIADHKKVA
jgi:hypothetical protein